MKRVCGWQWQRGHFCGPGMETFADGAVYLGSYLDGLAEGLGICLYANGSFYEGQVALQAASAVCGGQARWAPMTVGLMSYSIPSMDAFQQTQAS